MPKSRRRAVRMISPVSNTACLLIALGTSATGIWMVSGTTRNLSLASIITARRAPVRWARNSVWPGKAKPAPFSTALWMGAVTSAAASPARHDATAISIVSVTAAALALSGLPGMAVTLVLVGISAHGCAEKIPASPTSFSGWVPTLPTKCAKAASATSGPIPDGSPMVMRMGALVRLPDKGIGLAVVTHLDIGVALQVAQIAPRQGGDLALEQLVFHLLAGRPHRGGLWFYSVV